MIPTQFGNVPDVALEEIKQFRAQQQQQLGSIPLQSLPFASISNNLVNSSNTTSDTIANQIRSTNRDLSINSSNALVRSRSLATNAAPRPSIVNTSSFVVNPTHQTPLLTTNKQSFFSGPTRFGVSRLLTNGIPNNNLLPPGPSTSSSSYGSNRSLPISTSPNIRPRHIHIHNNNNNNSHHPPSITINSATTTTTNDQQRPHYETTYRTSFLKPLVP